MPTSSSKLPTKKAVQKEDAAKPALVTKPDRIGKRASAGKRKNDESEHDDKIDSGSDKATSKPKRVARQKAKIEEVTIRDPTPRPELSDFPSIRYFRALSWNVNGLRGTLKNSPEALSALVSRERPDLLCLQETKLQDQHVSMFAALLPGYEAHWSCSTKKKGYSGTVVFTSKVPGAQTTSAPQTSQKQAKLTSFFDKTKKTKVAKSVDADIEGKECTLSGGSELPVVSIRMGFGADEEHEGEGRAITVEYQKFFVVCLYVPNSGQNLNRLDYRTERWDTALREHVSALEKEGKPVIVMGDLNVAHLDLDIYNAGAHHLVKQAGCTPQERASFDNWVNPSNKSETEEIGAIRDAFRHFYPTARGCYTYWSTRTNGRASNKGLRLDYVLCTPKLLPKKNADEKSTRLEDYPSIFDVFHDDASTVGLSDHCPVGFTLELN